MLSDKKIRNWWVEEDETVSKRSVYYEWRYWSSEKYTFMLHLQENVVRKTIIIVLYAMWF